MIEFAFAKESMRAIWGLQKGEILVLRNGKLIRKRSWFKQKKIEKEIQTVFAIFCHPAKNPLHRQYLRKVLKMTLRIAHEAIAKLENQAPLLAIVDSYHRRTLMQLKILKESEKAARRKPGRLVRDARKALQEGKGIGCPGHGCSGVYYMPGSSVSIAGVFKPLDEEIGGPNNPHKKSLRGVLGQQGGLGYTYVGRSLMHEEAAYLVDCALQLGIVPFTAVCAFEHPSFYDSAEGRVRQRPKRKIGSFQEYCAGLRHVYEMGGLGRIPLDMMQRVLILDCLIGNHDRNNSNLMTDGRRVVAIDHGLSFSCESLPPHFLRAFVSLPQLKEPLLPKFQKRLAELDIDALCAQLRARCSLDWKATQRMKERWHVLQQATQKGQSMKECLLLLQPRKGKV